MQPVIATSTDKQNLERSIAQLSHAKLISVNFVRRTSAGLKGTSRLPCMMVLGLVACMRTVNNLRQPSA
jgi:hypothetical protein